MTSLHHSGLTVADMERALAFWRDGLGMEVVSDQEARDGYFGAIVGEPGARCHVVQLAFPDGGHRIELFEFLHVPRERPAAPPRRVVDVGFAHVCVACADLDALLVRLERGGGQRMSDPVEVTAGVNRGARALYVRDPDGHVLELLQRAG